MTLEKALEILELFTEPDLWACNQDDIDAIRLGIEALKKVKERRGYDPDFWFEKLPGETE